MGIFIREKSDTFDSFKNLCIKLKNEKNYNIGRIVRICNKYSISHEFSSPKTSQQNGVVERKNRTLQEMARVMLNNKKLSKRLWVEAINTTCHTTNRVYFRPGTKKTPYELCKGRKPNVSYFRVFGSVCYILNDIEYLGKFDFKSDDGVFLGYSMNSKAYSVYNMSRLILFTT